MRHTFLNIVSSQTFLAVSRLSLAEVKNHPTAKERGAERVCPLNVVSGEGDPCVTIPPSTLGFPNRFQVADLPVPSFDPRALPTPTPPFPNLSDDAPLCLINVVSLSMVAALQTTILPTDHVAQFDPRGATALIPAFCGQPLAARRKIPSPGIRQVCPLHQGDRAFTDRDLCLVGVSHRATILNHIFRVRRAWCGRPQARCHSAGSGPRHTEYGDNRLSSLT